MKFSLIHVSTSSASAVGLRLKFIYSLLVSRSGGKIDHWTVDSRTDRVWTINSRVLCWSPKWISYVISKKLFLGICCRIKIQNASLVQMFYVNNFEHETWQDVLNIIKMTNIITLLSALGFRKQNLVSRISPAFHPKNNSHLNVGFLCDKRTSFA